MKKRTDQLASPTLAEIYYKQGDLKRAIYVLRQALLNNPVNLDARLMLEKWEREFFENTTLEQRKQIEDKLKQIMKVIGKESRG